MKSVSAQDAVSGSSRLEWVDMVKGIALIGIIINHTALGYCLSYIDNMLVPVFWFCAGLTSKPDFTIRRKCKALLRPYFLMAALCLIYALIFSFPRVDWHSIAGIFYSRFKLFAARTGEASVPMMQIHDSVLWFLTSLFTAYCVYRIILIPKRMGWQSVAVAGSFMIGYVMQFIPVLLPWSIDTAFFIAPMMWTGYCMKRLDLIRRHPLILLAVCVAIYIVSHAICGVTNFSIRDYGDSYTASAFNGLSGAIACVILCRYLQNTRLCRVMAIFNRQALYIFGLQLVFFSIVENFAAGFNLPGRVVALIEIVVAAGGGWWVGTQNSELKWKRIFGKSD